jgi:tetratricopeptide (TPR) repeat protein
VTLNGQVYMINSKNVELARQLVELARTAEKREENDKALGLFDDALAALGEHCTDPYVADVLRWKGTLLRERGETEAAFRCYSASLEKARATGSIFHQAHALNCLGTISQRRCEHKETERLYAEAAELAVKAGEARLLGMIEQNRGVLASMCGDYGKAAVFYANSLGAFETAGDTEPMSWVLNNLGILHTKQRNYGQALEYLQRGLAIAITRDDSAVKNVITLNIAEAWIGQGRLDKADIWCIDALGQAQRRGDHLSAAGALRIRAAIERQRGALDMSIATLRIAIYEGEGAEDRLLHAEMLRELGEISRAVGNAGAARSALREAVDSFAKIGAVNELTEARDQLELLQ